MVMCCEKMTMTRWRNVWSMKLRVQDQGEDQRRPGKRLYVRTVKHVSWIKRMPWSLQMEKGDKGSTMIRMGVSGWMFLLVPAYPGCPGSKAVKRSLLLLCLRKITPWWQADWISDKWKPMCTWKVFTGHMCFLSTNQQRKLPYENSDTKTSGLYVIQDFI